MAMAPGATISSASKVVIEARVSKHGSADPASGDLVGKSAPVTPGSTNIHVRIDAVNP
jgi:cytochrome c-type biogenesis protein CcmH